LEESLNTMPDSAPESPRPPVFYFVAGEPSGDRHASLLARELVRSRPGCRIAGVGGAHLRSAGQEQLFDLAAHAVVGLTDVLLNYRKFHRFFHEVLRDIETLRPDVLVLVDYPGFNLRLAEAVRARIPGIRIAYYVSPQLWAWKPARSRRMRRLIDLVLVLFKFEQEWFARHEPELPVVWVGHPMLDRWRGPAGSDPRGEAIQRIALLPGSREKEIRRHLPILLKTASEIRQFLSPVSFAILATDDEARFRIEETLRSAGPVVAGMEINVGYQLTHLSRSDLALVASGTATLECCLAGVPMLVLYKVHPLTYWLGRKLVKIPYLAMVNILAGEKIVPEFLQDNADPAVLADAVRRMARDARWREAMKERLEKVTASLGGPGASERAAGAILKLLDSPARSLPLS
jgi:lipid-A-disaccharide synthase